MAKFKSLVKHITLDFAGRKHSCQHNQSHTIHKGQIRLKLRQDRTDEHFCKHCGLKMLELDVERLKATLTKLQTDEINFC